MEPRSLAETLFGLQQAIDNCERSGNVEWLAKHREQIRALCKLLPSGSGIDNGTKLVEIDTDEEMIILSCEFHHMNEHGSYDGWTEHTIRVRPSFTGLHLNISGKNRNEIKDYLHEVYTQALSERVHFLDGRWVSIDLRHDAIARAAEASKLQVPSGISKAGNPDFPISKR
jgi:hypothetical protein